MKYSIFGIAILSAQQAVADPGHLISVAGHGHWLAAGAIGAAIAAGIWGALKGKRDVEPAQEADEADSDEPQEA